MGEKTLKELNEDLVTLDKEIYQEYEDHQQRAVEILKKMDDPKTMLDAGSQLAKETKQNLQRTKKFLSQREEIMKLISLFK